MKKFAKILVVALTVCLIVGVMAVSASAADSSSEPSGMIKNSGSLDGTVKNSGKGPTSANGCVQRNGMTISLGGHAHTSTSTTCPSGGWFFVNAGAITGDYKDYNYLAIDFDFHATGYYDANGNVDADAESGMLSYTEGMRVSLYNGAYGYVGYFVLGTNEDNKNNWYFSADKVYDESDVPLATDKGVNNHITVIDNGSKIFLFVNGEYVAENTTFKFKGTSALTFGFSLYGAKSANVKKYSVEFANTQTTTYYDNYSTGDAIFGIDDYLKLADYNMNLYTCEDVVRDADYMSANLATFTYKSPVSENIRTGLYDDVNKALAHTENDDLDNGWYDVKINSWKLEDETQEIVPGETYTLVPNDVEAVAAVKYKANLTFLDKYQFNIYVKVPDTNAVTGVSFDGGTKSEVTLPDEANYYCLTSDSTGYSILDNPSKFSTSITFTPVYADFSFESITYTATVTLDGYLTQANEFYNHEVYPKEAKLLANFFNYAKECYEYNGGEGATIDETWQTKLDEIHQDCDCLKSTLPTTSGLNHEGENLSGSGYSVGYYFELSNAAYISRVGLAIYVPTAESVEASSIKATLKGIKDNKTNQNITVSFTKLAATQTVGDVECNVYLSNLGDLAIYNMLETVTITIGDKSGTFNLAEYVVANPTVEYTNALYRFAEAAKAYKEDGKTLVQ